jgi:hypothetical protein
MSREAVTVNSGISDQPRFAEVAVVCHAGGRYETERQVTQMMMCVVSPFTLAAEPDSIWLPVTALLKARNARRTVLNVAT